MLPVPSRRGDDIHGPGRSLDPLAGHPESFHWIVRALLALAFSGVAIAARGLLTPSWGADVKLIMFVPPVLFAAWVGGLWSGLITTASCGLAATYLWLSPEHSFHIVDSEEAMGMLAYLCVGALTSVIIDLLHRTRHRVERESARLAALALDRTRLIQAESGARA